MPLLLCLAGAHPTHAQDPYAAIGALPLAATHVDGRAGVLSIEFPALEVPAGRTILTRVYRVAVPFDASLYGFAVEILDEAGAPAPRSRLHHIILTDPGRRDLFAPLALPIFGASKESPSPILPKYLVGVPLPKASHYIAAAMLVNPEARSRRFTIRLKLSYICPRRFLPLFSAYPWTMDVQFPLGGEGGRHDFEIPAGHSTFSWQGSPRIPGTIIALGGHAHDYATVLRLVDVTTGDTLWHQAPVRDAAGRVLAIPVSLFYRWNRLGVRVEPSHTYRLTVEYDNPIGHPIPFGGMGSVAGLMVPDRGRPWPPVETGDPIFRAQIRNLLNNMTGVAMGQDGHGMH